MNGDVTGAYSWVPDRSRGTDASRFVPLQAIWPSDQALRKHRQSSAVRRIYELMDGFDKENTGKRGIPPTVARASEEIRMAYFTASISPTYAARAFESTEHC